MRFTLLAAATLALSLLAATAAATVTEPNGLQVPVNQQNGEIRLDAYFASINEPIDWQADAHATPNAFSPLCGFTAKFVLNQAGSHFGLAWYNETGVKPAANQLHQLVAPNSPVGTTFNGTAIKNDPAYMGGLVGFALIGGETHYTNDAYDTIYGANNMPWVTALMYASKNTPNAYYICFEDGGTSAGGWNNDGDFNDDVFFLTGITCSGGGQACDTGKPGICGPGVTQCTANGVVCQQLSQPAAMETCNGLDDDCNGTTDEGDICPAGQVCVMGACVQSCQGGEFNCPPSKVCSNDGHCVDPACNNVTCPGGQVCIQGVCKGPCDGVTCPQGQVCRVGACVDPCAGIMCDASQVCDGGVCVARCDCLPCAAGKACDATSGLCGDPACMGVMCAAGTDCVGGACVDACMGVTCPAGQACMTGQCVAVQGGAGGAGGSTSVGFGVSVGGAFGAGGAGVGGSGVGGAGASKGTGAGHTTSTGSGGSIGTGSKGKCGCHVAGDDSEGGELAWMAIAALGLAAARRRRR